MYKEIYNEMTHRYGKSTLTKKELANELSISINTINSYIVKGINLPNYKKLGNAKNSRVVFPIVEVAKYISHTQKVFNNSFQ